MFGTVVNTILLILLPYLIRMVYPWVVNYFSGNSNANANSAEFKLPELRSTAKTNPLTRNSLLQRLSKGIALLISGSYAYYLLFMQQHYSFYSHIDVSFDSPSYLIRNNLRDYIATARAYDEYFEEPLIEFSYPKLIKLNNNHNDDVAENQDLLSEYDYLMLVYELLKSKENRMNYLRFGDALLECEWCSEPMHYALFKFTKNIPSYFISLLLIGLVTGAIISTSNATNISSNAIVVFGFIRFYCSMIIFFCFSTELSLLFASPEILLEFIQLYGIREVYFDQWIFILKQYGFTSSVLLSCISSLATSYYFSTTNFNSTSTSSSNNRGTIEERMDFYVKHQRQIYEYLNQLKILNLSILFNRKLRQESSQFFSEKERNRRRLMNVPELKEAVKQYGNDDIMKEFYPVEPHHLLDESSDEGISSTRDPTPEVSSI